jgi:hypothetical protein
MSDNEEDDRPDQLFGGARPSTAPATRTLAEPAAPAEPVPVPPTEAMAAASLRPSTAAASSEAALPPPPPRSAATGGDEPISGASVSACPSFEALRSALAKTDDWQYSPDHRAGIERSKKYVEGSDKDFLAGFFVMSINEWKVSQPRVVILTRTAYYRVTYNPKNGKIDHYHKTTLDKVRVLEKTVTGLKVYLTEQDGKTSVSKMAGWLATKVGAKEAKTDEFEHVREYLPCLSVSEPSTDVVVDTMAAAMGRAAELMHAEAGTPKAVDVITTDDRKKLLADRKEDERLVKEKMEREAAEAELTKAMEEARE